MIKISNVTKIYNSKKKKQHKALNNISFTIPSFGMVFVLGKSGSGKSTLLNLIGGLDSLTSGTISVDGNDISSLKESEFANYRNTHIGFIFQDYHLIEELTVYENILLSLNLRREDDKGEVSKALDKVGLKGYESRFPTELSGGERQRVAIARAFVKKPRIILADEPTGNLDNNTGSQIIKLLKQLADDCLVLVVSHNLNEAYMHADRIIELSNGEIVNDLIRNPKYVDELAIEDDVLVYPSGLSFLQKDIDNINKALSSGNLKKIIKTDDKFLPYQQESVKEEYHEIINKNLSKRNTSKFALKFLKKKVLNIVLTSLMVSSIMTIFSLSESFVTFDSAKVINEKLKESNINSISMDKLIDPEIRTYLEKDYKMEIGKDDINVFFDANIGGQIKTIYSHTIPIKNPNTEAGQGRGYDFSGTPILQETLGTIVIDEQLIIDTYGKLEYLALADEIKGSGVYISDYVADCILIGSNLYANKGYKYSDLTGYYHFLNDRYNRAYINGIINTNYKQRYAKFINEYFTNTYIEDVDIFEDDDFINLSSEIYSLLGFSISFNENFKEDFINDNFLSLTYLPKINVNGKEYIHSSYNGFFDYRLFNNITLDDDQIIMSISAYNSIFGTEYTTSTIKDFIPHKVVFKCYRYYDIENENVLFEKEIEIVNLQNVSSIGICSDNLRKEFSKIAHMDIGLLFSNVNNIPKAIKIAESLNYEQNLVLVTGINTMSDIVEVFNPIFRLIAIVLFVAVVLVFTSFAMKMIKDKMHDIGVLKALGSKNRTIVAIFGLQLLLVAILTCLLSCLGYFIFSDLTNNLLLNSLTQLSKGRTFQNLSFISFSTPIVLVTSAITIVLSLFSLFIPMIRIRKIKPVKIIKVKE